MSKNPPRVTAGYQQISAALEDAIRGGRFQPGAHFPAETELMANFGVSRLTIRRALARLVEMGLIVRHQGRGSFVAAALPRRPVVSPLQQASRSHIDLTSSVDIKVLSRSATTMTPTLRLLFGTSNKNLVEEFVVVRSTKDQPLALILKYLPSWAGELIPGDDVAAYLSITDKLKTKRIHIKRLHQIVGAQSADPMIAARLNVQAGSPVLRFTRTSFDQNERAVIYTRAFFRSDLFEYDMEFIDGAGPATL